MENERAETIVALLRRERDRFHSEALAALAAGAENAGLIALAISNRLSRILEAVEP